MNRTELKFLLNEIFVCAKRRHLLDKIEAAADNLAMRPEDFIEYTFDKSAPPAKHSGVVTIVNSGKAHEELTAKEVAEEMIANGYTGEGMKDPANAAKWINTSARRPPEKIGDLFKDAKNFWLAAINHYEIWLYRDR
jgi:hypothetical protein